MGESNVLVGDGDKSVVRIEAAVGLVEIGTSNESRDRIRGDDLLYGRSKHIHEIGRDGAAGASALWYRRLEDRARARQFCYSGCDLRLDIGIPAVERRAIFDGSAVHCRHFRLVTRIVGAHTPLPLAGNSVDLYRDTRRLGYRNSSR